MMHQPSKFFLLLIMLFSVMSHAQATPTIAQKVLKPVITYQCESELKQSRLWRVSTLLMSDTRKINLQHNICECVGKNALNDIENTQLAKALVNEEAKSKLVHKAVVNSLNACATELLK